MFGQFLETFNTQSKAFFEPAFEMNKVAFGQLQQLGQKQLEIANDYAKLTFEQLEKVSNLKSVEDVQALTQENLKSVEKLSAKVVADTQSFAELGQTFGTEWKEVFESKLSNFEPKFDKVKASKK